MENRNGLIVDTEVEMRTGTAEWKAPWPCGGCRAEAASHARGDKL